MEVNIDNVIPCMKKPDDISSLRPITSLEMMKGQPDSFKKNQLMKESLKEILDNIILLLKDYVDTSEENYTILALWVMGTYYHDRFLTFPYLFFNAMKGSAKTRTLKLIKYLAKDGDMLASLSEAVLFRTAGTLCIDEFERIGDKDKNALRELLNTAYKKGGCVKRMRKKHTLDGDSQVVEEFDTFRPICMANISGMEEVLGDRCISLILEKSNNPTFTKKVEDFEWNPKFALIKSELFSVVSVVYMGFQNIYMDWNKYINYTTTPIHKTTPNYTIPQFPEELERFFNKLNKTEIDGRNLELFFPLILMADKIGILDMFLELITQLIKFKKADDIIESKDISLYQFITEQDLEWHKIKELTNFFRNKCGDLEQADDPWLNYKWMGKALKRLNLITEKRRVGEGIEVKLNIEKAKLKMEIFK